MTALPLLNLTLAVFLSPEFGFFGLVMPTFRHTPFICGLLTSAGETGFRARWATRQPRRTWLSVAWGWGVVVKVRCVGGREEGGGLDVEMERRRGVRGRRTRGMEEEVEEGRKWRRMDGAGIVGCGIGVVVVVERASVRFRLDSASPLLARAWQ